LRTGNRGVSEGKQTGHKKKRTPPGVPRIVTRGGHTVWEKNHLEKKRGAQKSNLQISKN